MSIKSDVRAYIDDCAGYYFTKRHVAEKLWPKWKRADMAATNDFRCFKSYIGNLVLLEKAAGNIAEADMPDTSTGAKYYTRVVRTGARAAAAAAKRNTDVSDSLRAVSTQDLVAELSRRFDI